jgi:5-methyltetrahydrofolate--homocysteine methyltransferase
MQSDVTCRTGIPLIFIEPHYSIKNPNSIELHSSSGVEHIYSTVSDHYDYDARKKSCKLYSMRELSALHSAIMEGDDKLALDLVIGALRHCVDPAELISRYMIPAMDEIGRQFEAQECYMPEILMAARAMKTAMEPLRPLLAASGVRPVGRVVIGTVKGDLHDIGKNMVGSLLEGAGFDVVDLGIDVPPEKFVAAVLDTDTDIVALSALLSVTLPEMKKTIQAFVNAGIRERIKVLVGGAPVTRRYADEIGADGYGENAGSAVTAARTLMGTGAGS